MVYDVVVVGTGCAGLTAAIVAAKKQGLTVLITERSRYLGGTTAFSNGGLWVPGNHYQNMQSTVDTKEQAVTYLRGVLRDEQYDQPMINSFLEHAPKMAKWLEENTALRFDTSPLPDYHRSHDGAMTGRSLRVRPFDGRKLGRSRIHDIRYVLQGFKLFDSMQVSVEERSIILNPWKNFTHFQHTVFKIFRYWTDLFWWGKGTFLANGNALVGSLIYSLDQEKGVQIWKNAPVTEIIMADGKAAGVVIHCRTENTTCRVRARKGIVLATGGLGKSKSSEQPQVFSLSPRSVTGDGIRLATKIGAEVPPLHPGYAIFAPISILRPKNKSSPIRMFPHFGYDRGKPGSVIVNNEGHRFISESAGYHQFVQVMQSKKLEECYFIADSKFLRKYGMGFALPSPFLSTAITNSEYLISARSVPELARKIGVPVVNLVRAVEANNENEVRGKDKEFDRGNGNYDKYLGDPLHKPHPNFGKCIEAPFYAVRMYPGDVSALAGVVTNEWAQVLGSDSIAISGLYAVGNDQDSLWKGTYPSGGSWLSPAMTFAFVAAEHMGRQPHSDGLL